MMYIVTVTPITRGSFVDELSYFSSQEYSIGSVIDVPIRKRSTQQALVLGVREAHDLKTEIKQAGYTLKKIPAQQARHVTPKSYIDTLKQISKNINVPIGILITHALPIISLSYTHKEAESKPKEPSYSFIQNDFDSRAKYYQSLTETLFAKGSSIFIICPTRHQAERLYKKMQKGIKSHTFLFHSSLSKKKQKEVWESVYTHKRPVLFISTPQGVAMPRKDLDTIVCEEEGSPHWIRFGRPHLNFLSLIQKYVQTRGLSYISGDILTRAETYQKYKDGSYKKEKSSTDTYPDRKVDIIDMHKYKKAKGYVLFAPSVERALKKQKGKTLVYVVRNGTYPLTECNDCGSIITCKSCHYPLVLYTKQKENAYSCHMCARIYTSNVFCELCKGQRFSLLGIGIERVHEVIKGYLPDTPSVIIDDSLTTDIQIRKKLKEFENLKEGLLITTEKGLSRLSKRVETTIVVSLDSLFSIPDLRMVERIGRIFLTLREHTKDRMYVQNRNGDKEMLEVLAQGDTQKFLDQEISQRKSFGLPPFTHLIKLSWVGAKEKRGENLLKHFKRYKPEYYRSFHKTTKGHEIYNVLLRVENKRWPDELLLEDLSSLPQSIEIQIDPESVI